MRFINYATTFDKVHHVLLFEDLGKPDIAGKDLGLLQNLYWSQTACVRVEGECSVYTQVARGVRQGRMSVT